MCIRDRAQFFACGDELLLPLARLDFAVFFFQQAGQHKDGVLGIGKGIAEFLHCLLYTSPIRMPFAQNWPMLAMNTTPAATSLCNGVDHTHMFAHGTLPRKG